MLTIDARIAGIAIALACAFILKRFQLGPGSDEGPSSVAFNGTIYEISLVSGIVVRHQVQHSMTGMATWYQVPDMPAMANVINAQDKLLHVCSSAAASSVTVAECLGQNHTGSCSSRGLCFCAVALYFVGCWCNPVASQLVPSPQATSLYSFCISSFVI